jgi:hypothetical protein
MIRQDCPCPKKKCERHGKCEECTAHHAKKGKLPYCKRPEKSGFGFFEKK